MNDPVLWNRIVAENGGIPLHSWQWARAKELSGSEVIWFFINDDMAQAAFPIYVKNIFGFRIGWVPGGLPSYGQSDHIYKTLKKSLRLRRVFCLITVGYEDTVHSVLMSYCRRIPLLKRQQTFILNLKAKSEEDIFSAFNKTTRKHIKRIQRSGGICAKMNKDDFEQFWEQYIKLCSLKGFKPTCRKEFLFVLYDLCIAESSGGLELAALKLSLDGQCRGYLVGLKFGNNLLEYLRANDWNKESRGDGAKLLNWELIKYCMESGVDYYDFGGVSTKKEKGIFDYKRGFGGEFVESSYCFLSAY